MKDRGNIRRYSLALATLVVAAALLSLSWPRMQASMAYLPVDTAINNYFKTAQIPAAQLDALVKRSQQAIDIYPHYRYYEGLSLLQYLQAIDGSLSFVQRQHLLRLSEESALEVVRKAPAKPRTWLRIARIRSVLRQAEAEIVAPLTLSILTGRVEPTLLLPRLSLGLAYLDQLDAEATSLLRDQALLSWRVNPRLFIRWVKDERLDMDQVRAVLGPAGSGVLDEMEAML